MRAIEVRSKSLNNQEPLFFPKEKCIWFCLESLFMVCPSQYAAWHFHSRKKVYLIKFTNGNLVSWIEGFWVFGFVKNALLSSRLIDHLLGHRCSLVVLMKVGLSGKEKEGEGKRREEVVKIRLGLYN